MALYSKETRTEDVEVRKRQSSTAAQRTLCFACGEIKNITIRNGQGVGGAIRLAVAASPYDPAIGRGQRSFRAHLE